MNISKPMFWHQGLLLQPQHLQLSDLYMRSSLEPFNRYLVPNFWGVIGMSIREDNLSTQTFGLYEGQFVFPDGTFAVYPGNAVVEPRSFADVWPEGGGPFTVYLGVQKWKTGAPNVSVVDPDENMGDLRTRYVSNSQGEEVPDLYREGPVANVKRLEHVLRIIWETEADDFNDYELIPIAQLVRNGKEIELSDSYFPPCVTCQSNNELSHMIRQITDQVAARCSLLEHVKRTSAIKSGSSDVADLVQFLGLRTLADVVSAMQPLAAGVDVHPWIVYRELANAVGKLSVFSNRIDASGKHDDGTEVMYPYNHHDLYGCFSSIQSVISFLLDEIVLGTENVLTLEDEGKGFFAGKLGGDMASDRYRYYLIVRTQDPAEKVRDNVLTMIKLASRKNIRDVTTRFVGGVPLDYVPYAPSGIPSISGAVYFHIDERSQQWGDILKEGEPVLYWNAPPKDINLQIAVQRNF